METELCKLHSRWCACTSGRSGPSPCWSQTTGSCLRQRSRTCSWTSSRCLVTQHYANSMTSSNEPASPRSVFTRLRVCFTTHTTILFSRPEKGFSMSQYIVCQMQYAKNTRMSYCIRLQRAFLAILTTLSSALDAWARGSKVKVQYYDKEGCPSCMHTACNSMYFVRRLQYVLKAKRKVLRFGTQHKSLLAALWGAAVLWAKG